MPVSELGPGPAGRTCAGCRYAFGLDAFGRPIWHCGIHDVPVHPAQRACVTFADLPQPKPAKLAPAGS